VKLLSKLAILSVFALGATAASAQTYPDRPVRVIVTTVPGPLDAFARAVLEQVQKRLKQPFVVENKAGAGGTIGADQVAKAAPDGYTLTLGTTSTHAIAAGAYSKLPYDPVKDFTHISLVAVTPYLLVVNPTLPVKTLPEFVTYAKQNAGKMNYGSAGNGTATHLSMEMLKDAAKIDMQHIPYKSNAESDRAIIAGEVDAVFGSMPALLANAKAGKVKPIAVGTLVRSPALPEIPTVAESGYPGFEAALWLGVMGPANMPRPVVERLHREIVAIVATPEFKQLMDNNGAEPVSSKTPQEFTDMLRGQVTKYVALTKQIGIKLD